VNAHRDASTGPQRPPATAIRPARIRGFSLIELVVAMCILGILTAIAVPSYMNYTRTSNRTDATRTITLDAQALERCYSQTFSYAGCSGPGGAAITGASGSTTNTTSSQGYYTVTINLPNAQSYIITATPAKSPQTGDSSCTSFTLNSQGTQGAVSSSGTNTTQTCWGST
jgi:type IV pilus assembly protein PilE